jgi:hypothetical protein
MTMCVSNPIYIFSVLSTPVIQRLHLSDYVGRHWLIPAFPPDYSGLDYEKWML